MNKKILLSLLAVILLVLALPIIGNKTISSTIESRLESLKDEGIAYEELKSDTTYFKSKKTYAFKVSDKERFIKTLSEQAKQQIPPYLTMMLDGTEVGVDLEYANIPIFDTISLDIYPHKLPKAQMQELKSDSKELYDKLITFLDNKMLLYHIEYDLSTLKFKGYLKDIKDGVMVNKETKLDFSLQKVRFSGQGLLMRPDSYKTDIDSLIVSAKRFGNEIMAFKLLDVHGDGTFKNSVEYETNMKVKKLELMTREDRINNAHVNIENSSFVVKTGVDKNLISGMLNVTAKSILFEYQKQSLALEGIGIDLGAKNIDKVSFENAQKAAQISDKSPTAKNQQLSMQTAIAFVSKGFNITLNKVNVNSVKFDKENLEGFNAELALNVKADDQLINKLNNPQEVLKNIDAEGNMNISEKLFSKLKESSPGFVILDNIAIKKDSDVTFQLELHDGNTLVNGKKL